MRQQRQVDKQMPDQVVVAESLLRINDRSGRIEDPAQQDQQQQDQNQDQQQNQDQKAPEQKQQDKGGLSQQNADQILKAMEDKENATRQKLERMKYDRERQASKRTTDKPW